MICIGGMHGNNRRGFRYAMGAAELTPDLLVRGEPQTLSGNGAALARRCRYIAQDLNRLWTADRIAAIRPTTLSNTQAPEGERTTGTA